MIIACWRPTTFAWKGANWPHDIAQSLYDVVQLLLNHCAFITHFHSRYIICIPIYTCSTASWKNHAIIVWLSQLLCENPPLSHMTAGRHLQASLNILECFSSIAWWQLTFWWCLANFSEKFLLTGHHRRILKMFKIYNSCVNARFCAKITGRWCERILKYFLFSLIFVSKQ